jgi:hypothetical protein
VYLDFRLKAGDIAETPDQEALDLHEKIEAQIWISP